MIPRGLRFADAYVVLAAVAMLTACASTDATRPSESMAMLTGVVPILSVDGDELPEPALSRELSPGSHQIEVLHRTFMAQYRCRFRFTVEAGQVYELTVRPNPQPVVLYRVERHNWLVGSRHDEVLPEVCE